MGTTVTPIYTVGMGLRRIEEIVDLLDAYHLSTLIDIRVPPKRKQKRPPSPAFDKTPFAQTLAEYGIDYLDMSSDLGKYAWPMQLDRAIRRCVKAQDRGAAMALFCDESHPHLCHRYTLLGPAFAEYGVQLHHITRKGTVKTQDDVTAMLARREAAKLQKLKDHFGVDDEEDLHGDRITPRSPTRRKRHDGTGWVVRTKRLDLENWRSGGQ